MNWIPYVSKEGLSPRVRGNPVKVLLQRHFGGSIPACAGEPAIKGWEDVDIWVYPRVCGGTHFVEQYSASLRGLSPRVRGNLGEARWAA